jgi:1-deoxy-D-xylulose-5-phosphate synthase
MNEILHSVDSPEALRKLTPENLQSYADALRMFVIDTVSKTGGHFAANLGVVELTVALHYVFDTPTDPLIWDVGHQSYPHKIVTNRREALKNIRKWEGISGFPSRKESEFDVFGTGHSSTSLSAIAGLAQAARLTSQAKNHIAVIGDGALTAGQAFEALNHIGFLQLPVLLVLNDNHMGIDPVSGALSEHLLHLNEVDTNIFTNLGFQYKGPIDGHNLPLLIEALQSLKNCQHPVVLHVKTVKGKGYLPAEKEQTKWHATGGFDKINPEGVVSLAKEKFQDVAGKTVLELAEKSDAVVAITPAMISGSSLHFMQERFPERVFDVGIAEQHAVTFAAGLALGGKRPYCFIYSTFLQRALDQVIHDVCLQSIPVVFCVDRSGLVGEDGPTHHGVFDLPLLLSLPNTVVAMPASYAELRALLVFAHEFTEQALFIRYPRGTGPDFLTEVTQVYTIKKGKGVVLKQGKDIALLAFGTMTEEVMKLAQLLEANGYAPTVVNMLFAKPFDTDLLLSFLSSHTYFFTFEESMQQGGVGQSVGQFLLSQKASLSVYNFGIANLFVPHGKHTEQLKFCGLDADSMLVKIKEILSSR